MRRIPRPLLFLLLGMLLINVSVLILQLTLFYDPDYIATSGYSGPTWRLFWWPGVIALGIAQICLVSIWLFFGEFVFLARLSVTVVVIVFWVYLLRLPPGDGPWLVVALAVASEVGLVSFALRWLGLELVEVRPSGLPVARRGSEFQYSISNMFVWMTVSAVILATVKVFGFGDFPLSMIWISLAFGLSVVPIALASLWLALGRAAFLYRLLLFLLSPVSTAAVVLMVFVDFEDWSFYFGLYYFGLTAMTALFCLVSLLVVRMCGYRLQWRGGAAVAQGEPKAEEPGADNSGDQRGGAEKKPPDTMSDG